VSGFNCRDDTAAPCVQGQRDIVLYLEVLVLLRVQTGLEARLIHVPLTTRHLTDLSTPGSDSWTATRSQLLLDSCSSKKLCLPASFHHSL